MFILLLLSSLQCALYFQFYDFLPKVDQNIVGAILSDIARV